MVFSATLDPLADLPDVDQRLVAPGSRFEILNGRVFFVPPADEPHAETHSRVNFLLGAHRAPGYSVALYMLTRTSWIDDFAPKLSIYPADRDPRTGGRRLEELAFEIASAESLTHSGAKAAKLVARGVRRVFAIDLERIHVLEWWKGAGRWEPLEYGSSIVDSALAVPLPVDALLDPARCDDAVARAWRIKRHPEFIAEHAEGYAEGRAEAVLGMLANRGLEP